MVSEIKMTINAINFLLLLMLGASQVALVVKNPPANAGDVRMEVQSLGREDPLEEEMATHSSILAWRIPRTDEPGGLQSKGSQSQTQLSDSTRAQTEIAGK